MRGLLRPDLVRQALLLFTTRDPVQRAGDAASCFAPFNTFSQGGWRPKTSPRPVEVKALVSIQPKLISEQEVEQV